MLTFHDFCSFEKKPSKDQRERLLFNKKQNKTHSILNFPRGTIGTIYKSKIFHGILVITFFLYLELFSVLLSQELFHDYFSVIASYAKNMNIIRNKK